MLFEYLGLLRCRFERVLGRSGVMTNRSPEGGRQKERREEKEKGRMEEKEKEEGTIEFAGPTSDLWLKPLKRKLLLLIDL